jgi:hypothetical protein
MTNFQVGVLGAFSNLLKKHSKDVHIDIRVIVDKLYAITREDCELSNEEIGETLQDIHCWFACLEEDMKDFKEILRRLKF